MKKLLLVLAIAALVASAAQAEMIFGYDCTGGIPFMSFKLNDTQRIDAGLTYTSANSGNTTNLGLFGRFDNTIATVGNLTTSWAGALGINSTSVAGGSTTTLTLSGLMTAEYKVTKNLGVYGSIYLITLQNTSAGGTSTTNFMILTGDAANAYGGIRIYI